MIYNNFSIDGSENFDYNTRIICFSIYFNAVDMIV